MPALSQVASGIGANFAGIETLPDMPAKLFSGWTASDHKRSKRALKKRSGSQDSPTGSDLDGGWGKRACCPYDTDLNPHDGGRRCWSERV
jgi:hypothetical protein